MVKGKSLGNALYLSDTEREVVQKVQAAVTDPARIRVSDKGHPDICTVSQYHKAFNKDEYEDICERCKGANIGCVACKKRLAGCINTLLDPMREKRAYYEKHLDEVKELIINGSHKANRKGDATMDEVKAAMNIKL